MATLTRLIGTILTIALVVVGWFARSAFFGEGSVFDVPAVPGS